MVAPAAVSAANARKAQQVRAAAMAQAAAERLAAGCKRCRRCELVKPLSEFAVVVPWRHGDGHHSYCQPCLQQLRREWAAARRATRAAMMAPQLQRLAAQSRIAAICCGGKLVWHPQRDWWHVLHAPGCADACWQPGTSPAASLLCAHCGQPFMPDARRHSTRRYCSEQCRVVGNNARRAERAAARRSQPVAAAR